MRPIVSKCGDAWLVTLGEDEFPCATEREARDLSADLSADLASRYVECDE